jgi:hypothetical protein
MPPWEFRRCGQFEQSPASQGKSAIADRPIVLKLRPWRADIIIVEEFGAPLRGIDDEPIPLNDQHVRQMHEFHEPSDYELAIVLTTSDRIDPLPFDICIQIWSGPISQQAGGSETNLIEAASQG